jgi:two-component system, LytTR family, response regulator
MKLKTVIVEDEKLGQDTIVGILNNYCNQKIEIVGIAADVKTSIEMIKNENPDLVFMDIKLGGNENGAFDILNVIEKINFKMIFTTSSKNTDLILRAVNQFGTKRYLLKPIDIDEVIDAVDLVFNEYESHPLQFKSYSNFNNTNCFNLTVPQKNGFRVVKCNELIMIRSNANSTILFLKSGENILSSKSLSYYETLLSNGSFVRTSRSFLINFIHVISYSKQDGGTILLSNDCTAALSDTYKDDFFKLFQ